MVISLGCAKKVPALWYTPKKSRFCPDAGHALIYEHPEIVNAGILDFLGSSE